MTERVDLGRDVAMPRLGGGWASERARTAGVRRLVSFGAAILTLPTTLICVPASASSPPTPELSSIAFAPDGVHGWAVGHTGSEQAGTASPVILATADGGHNWSPQAAPSGVSFLGGVAFADASHGWAAGAGAPGGVVIATVDGGRTWQRQAGVDGSGGGFTSVATVDPTHAWVAGGANVVSTANGNASWTTSTLRAGGALAGLPGSSTSVSLDGLAFTDTHNGWAVGLAQSGGNRGTGIILATHDGGGTWSQQYPDPLALSSTSSELTGVSFTDPSHGHAVGYHLDSNGVSGDQGVALDTSDGGSSWLVEMVPQDVHRLLGVSFLSNSQGWAVGLRFQGAAILGTTDGGRTWAPQGASLPAAMGEPRGIAAKIPTGGGASAWVSTSLGVIAATSDGGTSWQVQYGLPVTLSTRAASAAPHGAIADQATLTNASSPTGTLTFRLFGPSDPTCAGPALAQSVRPVSYDGDYLSDPFTAGVAGAYHWVASYSGDAANPTVAGACGDADETSSVPDRVSLSPRPQTATAGDDLPLTAHVTGGSTALPGMPVIVTVAGSNPESLSGVTDASGNASLLIQQLGPGSNTITAFADPDGDGVYQPGEPLDTFSVVATLPREVSGNASAVYLEADHLSSWSGLFPACQSHLASSEPPGQSQAFAEDPGTCQVAAAGASTGSADATGATEEITGWGSFVTGGVTAESRLARATLLPGRPGGALLDVSSVDSTATVSCHGGVYSAPAGGSSVGALSVAGIPLALPPPGAVGENTPVPVGPPGSPVATVILHYTSYDALHNVRTTAPLLVDFPPTGPLASTIVGQVAVGYASSGLQGCAPPVTAATVLTPSSLAFTPQMAGAPSAPLAVTLSNPSTTPMTVGSISTAPAEYSATSDCPATLAPGSACTISVTFTPAAAGNRPGTLTVSDSLAGSPHAVSLSGTGLLAMGGDASAVYLDGVTLLRGTPMETRLQGGLGICEAGPITTTTATPSTPPSGPPPCGAGTGALPVPIGGVTAVTIGEDVSTTGGGTLSGRSVAASSASTISLRLPDGTPVISGEGLTATSSNQCAGGAPGPSAGRSSLARLTVAGQTVATQPVGSRIIFNPTGRNPITVYGNPVSVNPTGGRVPMATVTLNYSRYATDLVTGARTETSSPAAVYFPPNGPLAGEIVGTVLLSFARSSIRGCG